MMHPDHSKMHTVHVIVCLCDEKGEISHTIVLKKCNIYQDSKKCNQIFQTFLRLHDHLNKYWISSKLDVLSLFVLFPATFQACEGLFSSVLLV